MENELNGMEIIVNWKEKRVHVINAYKDWSEITENLTKDGRYGAFLHINHVLPVIRKSSIMALIAMKVLVAGNRRWKDANRFDIFFEIDWELKKAYMTIDNSRTELNPSSDNPDTSFVVNPDFTYIMKYLKRVGTIQQDDFICEIEDKRLEREVVKYAISIVACHRNDPEYIDQEIFSLQQPFEAMLKDSNFYDKEYRDKLWSAFDYTTKEG
jgi:hypothetical protein